MPSTDPLVRPVSLAILCGGRSQRFGQDKGLFSPLGDEALIARAVRLWGPKMAEILVVVRDPDQWDLYREVWEALQKRRGRPGDPPVRLVHDGLIQGDDPGETPVAGALTGVRTALSLCQTDAVVVIPVDQVGVRSWHVQKLCDRYVQGCHRPITWLGGALERAGDGAHDDDGEFFPFPSLWPKHVLAPLNRHLAGGGLGVRSALRALAVEGLPSGDHVVDLAMNIRTMAEAHRYFGEPLWDPFGRRLQYLRFSLTEACNLSCRYCLPEGFPEWYRYKARMGQDAIETLTRGFRRLGFRKIRFTGGEPTVHPGCLTAVATARQEGFETIAMTTNGLLMGDIEPWIAAGLTHLNVSMDSLSPDIFHALTGCREVERVIHLIDRAIAGGLEVKVNTVLMRSINGGAGPIKEWMEWALARPLVLRFIELMDTGLNRSFAAAERVYGHEIAPILEDYGLRPLNDDSTGPHVAGPATEYGGSDHPGRIGLINPLSCNFCSKCNRLRVTARGALKLCLFGDQDWPLDLVSPDAVFADVHRLIRLKPEKHDLEEGRVGNVGSFRTIGG